MSSICRGYRFRAPGAAEWVVVSHPKGGHVVIVPVGSFVQTNRARLASVEKIETAIADGLAIAGVPLEQEHVESITSQLLRSTETPRDVLSVLVSF